MDWKLLWNYLKEPARWIAIALIAYGMDIIVPTMKKEYIPYMMIILRFADKWLHDIGKIVDSDTLTNGIVRF